MTWKQVYREVEKVGRESARNAERLAQQEAKAHVALEKAMIATRRKVDEIVNLVAKDPIKAMKLRYSAAGELDGQSVPIAVGDIRGTFGEEPTALDVQFNPHVYSVDSVNIEPVALYATDLFSLLAFRLSRDDPEDQIPLSWVKKTDPRASAVVLLDAETSDYHYPVSTDITGEVIPGHPRTGLIAFQPFRRPTESIAVHFSNIPVGKPGNRETFAFTCKSPDLLAGLESILEGPSQRDDMLAVIDEAEDESRKAISSKDQGTGCAIALAAIGLSALTLAAVIVVVLV